VVSGVMELKNSDFLLYLPSWSPLLIFLKHICFRRKPYLPDIIKPSGLKSTISTMELSSVILTPGTIKPLGTGGIA
jgi:hypothetical protein